MPADFFSLIGVLGSHLHTHQPGGASRWPSAAWRWSCCGPSPTPCRRRRVGLLGAPRRLGAHVPGTVIALVAATLATALAAAAGGDHRLALRRHPAGAAGLRAARVHLDHRQAAADADAHDRAAGRHRVAAVRARGRQRRRRAAPRPEPGADGAGRGQLRGAVLRRHPGHRHHRAHRSPTCAPAAARRWPASCMRRRCW